VGTPRNQHDQIRAKWATWLDDVKPHLFAMLTDREIWKATRQAVAEQAPETPGTWIQHYSRMYVATQTMAIRRLMLSRNPDRRSLAQLISNLRRHPDVMTRDRYVEGHSVEGDTDYWTKSAIDTFDRVFGDETGQLSEAKLAADQKRIEDVCGPVTKYADTEIAHIVEEARKLTSVTFNELDAAIELAGDMFKRYALLLTASDWMLPPVIQDNWRATLDRPLFPRPKHWVAPSTGG
jgi:hypothetical protein